jgi:polar amino acid transport system substrate-binding protein
MSTPPLVAAINLGNRVLAGRDAAGALTGISVDLALEIEVRLGREMSLRAFDRAVDVATSAEGRAWDVCFLAVDPNRAQTIAFTEPYVRIAGCYLVNARSRVTSAADVVKRGLRIGVVEGSAYTLHLARQPGAEHLVLMKDFAAALIALERGDVGGIAGIEQAMQEISDTWPGYTVLQPPFMDIRQAMGVPAGRDDVYEAVRTALHDVAAAGTLASILEHHGVTASSALLPLPTSR